MKNMETIKATSITVAFAAPVNPLFKVIASNQNKNKSKGEG